MAQEKKLTDRTLAGFLWMITGSGIQVFLKIGVLAILARLVGPAEFGIVGMAVIAIEFSKMFTQMGVGPAIVQRKELENRHLHTGFTLSVLMGTLFGGLLFLGSPLLETFFRMPGLAEVLKVVSLIFVIDSLTLIGQALLQRNMKFKVIAGVEVISYAVGYGAVGITLGYLGYGKWALVFALLAQSVLHAALIVFIQPYPKKPFIERQAFKELLHFGGGFTLARIGNYIALQGDNLVIGRMLGPAALGIYGRAYQFMVMPATLFGTALDHALFPAMAKVQDDKPRLGKAYLTGVGFIALAGIPLCVLLVFLAPEIVLVVLGPKWTEVILPFQILACSLLFRMSYKISDSLARATGAVYQRAWRQLIYAGLVVLGSYIGQFWGLYGVAAGVAGSLICNFLLMAHLSQKLTGFNWLALAKVHGNGLLLGLTSGMVTFVLVTLCRQHLESHLLTLVVTAFGSGLQVIAALWFFPDFFMSEDQKGLLHKLLLKRLKKAPAPEAAAPTPG